MEHTNIRVVYEYADKLNTITVGGTSGIGETTAREFARHTVEPRIYLVGRNQTEASRIIDELAKLNPDGKVSFVQTDASLLRSVDKACDQIKEKEDKINLLFLSPGVMTTKGRQGKQTPGAIFTCAHYLFFHSQRLRRAWIKSSTSITTPA